MRQISLLTEASYEPPLQKATPEEDLYYVEKLMNNCSEALSSNNISEDRLKNFIKKRKTQKQLEKIHKSGVTPFLMIAIPANGPKKSVRLSERELEYVALQLADEMLDGLLYWTYEVTNKENIIGTVEEDYYATMCGFRLVKVTYIQPIEGL